MRRTIIVERLTPSLRVFLDRRAESDRLAAVSCESDLMF
jgi:hypothetical protein